MAPGAIIEAARPTEAANILKENFIFIFGLSFKKNGADTIKAWSCEIDSCSRPSDARCGQILLVSDDGIRVACGAGSVLRLTVLQRAGGKRLPAAAFLRGFALAPGQVLGASA